MGDVYSELRRTYEQGELDEGSPVVQDLTLRCSQEVIEPPLDEFDRRIIRRILDQRAEEKGEIVSVTRPIQLLAFDPDRPDCYEFQKDYLKTYEEKHGRAEAFYHGLSESLSYEYHPDLVEYVLQELRAEDETVFGQELYEALLHEQPDGTPVASIKEVSPSELSPAGRVAAEDSQQQLENGPRGVAMAPLEQFEMNYLKPEELTGPYSTLLCAAPWGDAEWASFLKAGFDRTHDRDEVTSVAIMLEVFGSLHDRERVLHSDEPLDETLDTIADHRDEVTPGPPNDGTDAIEPEYLDRAEKGLHGAGRDVMTAILSGQNYEAFQQWLTTLDDVGQKILCRAAGAVPGDGRFVQAVLDRYDPGPDELNEALQQAVRGLARDNLLNVEQPEASMEALIQAGADPKQRQPTLFEAYLDEAYSQQTVPYGFYEGLELVEAISATPSDLSQFQSAFGPTGLREVGTRSAQLLQPLIRHGLLPTEDQLDKMKTLRPEIYEALVEQLPQRSRQAERRRQRT